MKHSWEDFVKRYQQTLLDDANKDFELYEKVGQELFSTNATWEGHEVLGAYTMVKEEVRNKWRALAMIAVEAYKDTL